MTVLAAHRLQMILWQVFSMLTPTSHMLAPKSRVSFVIFKVCVVPSHCINHDFGCDRPLWQKHSLIPIVVPIYSSSFSTVLAMSLILNIAMKKRGNVKCIGMVVLKRWKHHQASHIKEGGCHLNKFCGVLHLRSETYYWILWGTS